jgi:predicted ABC-type transport system involved in lysophospholipase L1 biosynthesis ATPase subunit
VIDKGDSVAVVGASGAGKSTLLALLAGLDLPTEGEIWLNGVNMTSLDEDGRAEVRAASVGFVFQSFHLVPSLNALENVMLPLELAGKDSPRQIASDILQQVGLEERWSHYPAQLSGGEKQRVAIARAFATEPAVLFADEPTGNLDSRTGEHVIDLMFELNRDSSTTLMHQSGRRPARQRRKGSRMKPVIYALRSFGRELRSGEVIVLLAAVALAVAALTAVGFLTDRIGRAVARQANEVLAADLRLRTPDPIPAEWHEMAADFSLQSAETQRFPSVVFAGDLSSLAAIMGVSDGYPLRGDVRISDSLFGEQRIAEGIPDTGGVWADGALMARLGVDVGDYISVGEAEMRIDAVLRYRPDQSIGFASLAPSLLIDIQDLPATRLINEGSRVRYALLVAGEEETVDEFWRADFAGFGTQPESRGRK